MERRRLLNDCFERHSDYIFLVLVVDCRRRTHAWSQTVRISSGHVAQFDGDFKLLGFLNVHAIRESALRV